MIISLTGAALAVLAIFLLARPVDKQYDSRVSGTSTSRTTEILALLAGFCFAGQFLALEQGNGDAGAIVITGSRVAVVLVVAVTLLICKRPVRLRSRANGVAAMAGVVILSGDILYFYALAAGPLTTASVLGGLHPVATIVLASSIARERVTLSHALGVVCAIAGASLIALGQP